MIMKKVLLFLWELPQLVAGWAVYFFCRHILKMDCIKRYKVYCEKHSSLDANVFIFESAAGSAVCFGSVILVFCKQRHLDNGSARKVIEHEFGHFVQSFYLGWLYLAIIGIPSIVVTWISANTARRLYTEMWAERIIEDKKINIL